MSYSYLLPLSYKEDIKAWLKEDVPSFDYGGFVVGNTLENAILYGKSPGVLAGVPFFNEVFSQLNCSVDWFLEEGECFEPVKEIAHVTGRACDILLGERTALNILARCSGIARRSKRCITLKETHKFQGIIAGTRKTTPGGKLIASILNTEILGPESSIAHMVNIRLPIKVDDGKPNIFESEFHELMFNKYNCYVMAFKHADKFYVRASAQVYTDLKDFEKVGYILKEICDSTSLTKYKL
ncbi:11749_t:CDS:2 [Entrophospora sp. SA101]|nr:11749_t:CDS:2 [Entrophospora sp. SA101]CAJ0839873.1 3507_t:CDS:2 [Entrophospora sp. SA101]